jgi:hypothetical protein
LFNNNVEDEADFCEAYKSQILGNVSTEKKSSVNTLSKILTILLLLIIIVAVSIYGYNYMMQNDSDSLPPSSIQIDDEELVVTQEDEGAVGEIAPKIEESDIDKMAKEVELAILKNDTNKSSEKKIENPLEVPTNTQAEYLEELAKLSEEIDKDKK